MDTHRNPAGANGGASEGNHAATLINSDTSPSAIVLANGRAAAPNARTEARAVAKLLEAHPDKSDRQIAATAKTDQEAAR